MTHAVDRKVLLLTEAELRKLVPLDATAIDAVEDVFCRLSGGDVVMPPVLSMQIPDAPGEVDIKTAYVPGVSQFAVKVSPGFFKNPALGLPSLNGMMIALSSQTGLVEAILLDNGYLTNIRTAAAGAVAARALSRANSNTLGVYGSGMQARLQAQAVALTRSIERVLIWGRNPESAENCASDLTALGLMAEVMEDPQRVAAESDILVTTTPSEEPILMADWLQFGHHVTAMGSDQEDKNELDPAILAQASCVICDRISQCAVLGELRAAKAAGVAPARDLTELGDVVSGKHPGRRADSDITVADLTGTGAQDTAIASLAVRRAQETKTGTVLSA